MMNQPKSNAEYYMHVETTTNELFNSEILPRVFVCLFLNFVEVCTCPGLLMKRGRDGVGWVGFIRTFDCDYVRLRCAMMLLM